MDVSARLAEVRERITAAGGDPGAVTVVAVTKGFGGDAVRAALDAGLDDVGENYAQELLTKLVDGARWHFLGLVQRNKVRSLAPHVHLWQGVDRQAAGREIARRAPGARVLVEVNTSGEPQKQGCRVEDAPALVDRLGDLGLDVRGLMTVGATGDPERARSGFRVLRELADGLALPVRSMGMTDDLEAAVQEGTTMVRVGRALFGERPPPHAPRR